MLNRKIKTHIKPCVTIHGKMLIINGIRNNKKLNKIKILTTTLKISSNENTNFNTPLSFFTQTYEHTVPDKTVTKKSNKIINPISSLTTPTGMVSIAPEKTNVINDKQAMSGLLENNSAIYFCCLCIMSISTLC
jgi:hypothetical protein